MMLLLLADDLVDRGKPVRDALLPAQVFFALPFIIDHDRKWFHKNKFSHEKFYGNGCGRRLI